MFKKIEKHVWFIKYAQIVTLKKLWAATASAINRYMGFRAELR